MKGEEMREGWQGISEEILNGMVDRREEHPKATFREIEEEVDRRLSELRVRMLADVANSSAQAEWAVGEAAVCPECGAQLVKKGKKKRKLQTREGREIEFEREYGVCPECGQGIFPPGCRVGVIAGDPDTPGA